MAQMNAVGWFEIGTDRPDVAERFYGEVFGWTFADDESPGFDGRPYRLITTPAAGDPAGGLTGTDGKLPNYAVFSVVVADTAATCRRAEEAGGKVLVPPQTAPNGLVFAHILDPSGNQVGVFTPPAAG